MMNSDNNKWDLVITSKRRLFDFNISELWKYRDLTWFFIKRDYKAIYKQTVLGPIWLFLQPLLSSFVYVIIFNKIAKISTDEVPPHLFYLSGIILWNYFYSCLNQTSNTFGQSNAIFKKVYFPRLIDPISKVISNLLRLAIQFILFLTFYSFYMIKGFNSFSPNFTLLILIPLLILQLGLISQGLGMMISALTVKYRDLIYLISFGSQLIMYITPIVYPASIVPERYMFLILANPLTYIIEAFRHIFLNTGFFNIFQYLASFLMALIIFFFGLILFNRMEKNSVDTV